PRLMALGALTLVFLLSVGFFAMAPALEENLFEKSLAFFLIVWITAFYGSLSRVVTWLYGGTVGEALRWAIGGTGAGFFIGLITLLLLQFLFAGEARTRREDFLLIVWLFWLPTCALAGAIGGAVFGVKWRKRRPAK